VRLGEALMTSMKTHDVSDSVQIIAQLIDLLGEEHERVQVAKKRLQQVQGHR
jgi:hypothetical protein